MTPRNVPRRLLTALGLAAGLAGLVLLGLGGMLALGVPGPVMDALLDRVNVGGSIVRASRMSYRPGRGWLLEDVEVYAARNRVTPWARIDQLALDPRGAPWNARDGGRVEIRGGSIDTDLGFWADDLVTRQPLRMERIRGRFQLSETLLRVEELRGIAAGMEWRLEGGVPAEMIQAGPGAGPARDQGDRIARMARNLAPAVDFLEGFRFDGRPVATIRLTPDPEASPRFAAEIELSHTRGGRHRGFSFRGLSAHARYRDGSLTVDPLVLRESDERALSVTAELDFEAREVEMTLDNTLRRYGLEAVSPVSLARLLSNLDLRVQDRADFVLSMGPSAFDRIGNRFTGRFAVEDAFYKDTFFPNLTLDLEYRDRVLNLDKVKGTVGQGAQAGPVAGSLRVDLDTGGLELDVEGGFKPAAAISLARGTAESVIREWEFPDAPPTFDLTLSIPRSGAPVDMTLRASAATALCRGIYLEDLRVGMEMDAEGVRVSPLTASRGEATFKGNFSAPPDFSHLDVNVVTSFPPPEVSPFLGEGPSGLLRPFRFDGTNWMQLEGRVDLSGSRRHDLHGKVTTTDMVYRWLKFSRFSASFDLEGETLTVPDIRGGLVEGALEASVTTRNTFSPDGTFTLDLKVEDMDLHKVITAATDQEDTPYTGTLTMDLDLEGGLRGGPDTSRAASFAGGGRMNIREGELFRIPLLLGLSRILDKVVSGFGYAAQSDFSADFRIADGRVESDNLFLRGNIVSIAGAGYYRFDGKIGANLKIQLLNRGLLSEALKVLLWPIRKLIEVRLTGTLDNPDWQPRNLPKELFGK